MPDLIQKLHSIQMQHLVLRNVLPNWGYFTIKIQSSVNLQTITHWGSNDVQEDDYYDQTTQTLFMAIIGVWR